MKQSNNITTSLYEHLEQSGVLQSGDEQRIQAERRKYRNAYKAQWRRKKRKEQKECTISFTKNELKQITGQLSSYQCSVPQFVKMIVLQYLEQAYVPIHSQAINQIRALLMQNYTLLQTIEENQGKLEQSDLLQQFTLLEQTVLEELYHPRALVQAVQESIQRDARIVETLHQLLENHHANT